MSRAARVVVAGLICAVALWLPAAAAPPLHHAGLVIRHGDGELIYAYVSFREQTISGFDLLERSGIPVVTIPFGGLGEGVCEIDDEGCPVAACRRRLCQGSNADSPFWQVFSQSSVGHWQSLALGASSLDVHNGDVVGWSWTGDGAHLPALTLADVARQTGASAGAAELAGNQVPTPAVRHVLPPGVTAHRSSDGQSPLTYGAAVIVLGLIGGGGLLLRRRRQRQGAP